MYIVYRHLCDHNDKSYVGITQVSDMTPDAALINRWNGHCNAARSGSELVFHRAIVKHGMSAFSHSIIALCDTLDEACRVEIEMIRENNSLISQHGYNMTCGGEGMSPDTSIRENHRIMTSEGTKRAFMNDNVRKKHRAAVRKTAADPCYRARMSDIQKCIQNQLDVSEKKSRSLKEAWKTSTKLNGRKKVVVQHELKTGAVLAVFQSAHDASRETGVPQGNISLCARGVILTAGGFDWAYADFPKTVRQRKNIRG